MEVFLYESRQDILKCVMNGSIPDVGFKYDREQRFFDLEYIPAEITDELRKSTLPKDIQTCLHAGVLPDCYKGSTISVALQKKNQISIGYNTNVVFTHMYGIPNIALQQPPPGAVPHNSFNRKTPDARVRLTIRRDPDLMQKRKEVIEHPFGTIKWYDGAHYFLCKGKEKVSAEIALSFLTYNLRRAIKLKGAGALIAAIRERKHKNRG